MLSASRTAGSAEIGKLGMPIPTVGGFAQFNHGPSSSASPETCHSSGRRTFGLVALALIVVAPGLPHQTATVDAVAEVAAGEAAARAFGGGIEGDGAHGAIVTLVRRCEQRLSALCFQTGNVGGTWRYGWR